MRLCIDLQKSLNGRDDATLQLMQEKNKNQILLQEIIQLREAIRNYKKTAAQRLAISSLSVAVCIDPALTASHHSCRPSESLGSQNSNADHLDYQFSEVEDRRELIEKLEDISIRRESSAKKSIRDRITITYGQPYMLKPHYRPPAAKHPLPPPTARCPLPPAPSSPANKSYDSLLQYKRRFIERKP